MADACPGPWTLGLAHTCILRVSSKLGTLLFTYREFFSDYMEDCLCVQLIFFFLCGVGTLLPSRRGEVLWSPSSLPQFTRPELCRLSLCSDSWDKPECQCVHEARCPGRCLRASEPELSNIVTIQDSRISVYYPPDPHFGDPAPVYVTAFGVTPLLLFYWSHSVTRLTIVSC